MEDEEYIRIDRTYYLSAASVEIFQNLVVRSPPWLIDGLKCINSGMVTPLIHQIADVINAPIDVVIIDPVIFLSIVMTHP